MKKLPKIPAKQLLSNVLRFVKGHSTEICTIVGIGGVIATGYTAAKAAPEAEYALDDAQAAKGSDLTVLEKAKVLAPYYAPSVIAGATSIGCILGANKIHTDKEHGLESMLAATSTAYAGYRSMVTAEYGEEADQKIRKSEVFQKYYDEHKNTDIVPEVAEYCKGDQLYFESFSGRYFTANKADVEMAFFSFNRLFSMAGYASLNELYKYLGLSETNIGRAYGWTKKVGHGMFNCDYIEVNFIPIQDGDEECIVIDFVDQPVSNYLSR